ncbi:MAG: hypothetical protein MUE66_10540 [Acidimicrobiia bacterium]|nr:hypothetical protein [Acidimicrobiia bacterium]
MASEALLGAPRTATRPSVDNLTVSRNGGKRGVTVGWRQIPESPQQLVMCQLEVAVCLHALTMGRQSKGIGERNQMCLFHVGAQIGKRLGGHG